MSGQHDRISRYGATRDEVEGLVAASGEPRYRADQLWQGLYDQRRPLDAITPLGRTLRDRLGTALPTDLSVVAEQTGDAGATTKWLWAAADGAQVETVLMRYPDRATVCVSSQAGCAMGCSFCATGQVGFERHLSTGEIVEQVLRAQHGCEQRVSNVVFMGMGEPLANEEAVWAAVERLHHDVGLSARHITVSTVGVVPGMRALARRPLPVTLAVSLHAPDDELRDRLVPLNRRYPIADVLAAAAEYRAVKGRRVTFEYVMLDGVNDAPEQADRLGALLEPHAPVHVNLIPYNPTPGLDARSSPRIRAGRFAQRLEARGLNVSVRRNRGVDIDAACGQLRARTIPDAGGESARMIPVAVRGESS